MAKTIAVDPEAYALLSKVKKPGETFSDVVKRALRPRRPISEFAGAWGDLSAADWDRIRNAITEGRRLDATRRKRVEALWKD